MWIPANRLSLRRKKSCHRLHGNHRLRIFHRMANMKCDHLPMVGRFGSTTGKASKGKNWTEYIQVPSLGAKIAGLSAPPEMEALYRGGGSLNNHLSHSFGCRHFAFFLGLRRTSCAVQSEVVGSALLPPLQFCGLFRAHKPVEHNISTNDQFCCLNYRLASA